MTGDAETCPFCATHIPHGASVCRGCGANKGIRGEIIWPLLLFGAIYVVLGPIAGLMAVANLGSDAQATPVFVFSLIVIVAGFFPIRWMCRKLMEPVWRRFVA